MPKALPLGVTLDGFWELNPRKINILIRAFDEKEKADIRKQNMLMHLQGMYFVDALLATVGNMFKSKGQKSFEYPKEAYSLDLDYEGHIENEDERKAEMQRRQFVNNLNNLFGEISRSMEDKDAEY